MGVLDSYVGFGVESTYGTPVTVTRSFEVEADGPKREVQHLERRGFRAGIQAVRSSSVRTIGLGAAGDVPLTVMSTGFGMLFKAMMGTSASALDTGATAAYLQQHDTASTEPADSLTAQYVRGTIAGTQAFTYHGGKVTGWEISQELDDLMKMNLSLDYEDEETSTAAHTATYPTGGKAFAWDNLVVTVSGTPVDVRSFSVSGNQNVKTNRRFLRGSALKKEPFRQGMPTFEGNIAMDFENTTYYDLFVSGATVPIVATWTLSDAADEIEAGKSPYVKLTIPAAQFRGETPEVSMDDVPTQPLPFVALWDESNPAVSLDYLTADTTY